MICKLCCDDADGTLDLTGECGVCGREFEKLTVNGLLPYHKQKVLRQDTEGRVYYSRAKCSGSGLPAMRGHALCRGCDCQHKRREEGYVTASAAPAAE
jgi:hypothetical protein